MYRARYNDIIIYPRVKARAQMINRLRINVHEKNAGVVYQMSSSMTRVAISVSHLVDSHLGRKADRW